MRLDQFEVMTAWVMGVISGFVLTLFFAVNPLKKEAVERGYAEWVVNASGDAKWQWKEAK